MLKPYDKGWALSFFLSVSLAICLILLFQRTTHTHTHTHLKNTLAGPTAKLVDCLVIVCVCVCGRVKRVTQFKTINQVV